MEHGVQNKRIGVDDLNRHLRFESEQTEVMMPLDALIHAGFSMSSKAKRLKSRGRRRGVGENCFRAKRLVAHWCPGKASLGIPLSFHGES
jgi:hypothetical protein